MALGSRLWLLLGGLDLAGLNVELLALNFLRGSLIQAELCWVLRHWTNQAHNGHGLASFHVPNRALRLDEHFLARLVGGQCERVLTNELLDFRVFQINPLAMERSGVA